VFLGLCFCCISKENLPEQTRRKCWLTSHSMGS